MQLSNTYIAGYYAIYLNDLGNMEFVTPSYLVDVPELHNVKLWGYSPVYDPLYNKEVDIIYREDLQAWVPTKERSLIDEIRQQTIQDEFLCFAIEDYLDFEGTLDDLREVAKRHNMLEEFDAYYKYSLAFIEDHFNHM